MKIRWFFASESDGLEREKTSDFKRPIEMRKERNKLKLQELRLCLASVGHQCSNLMKKNRGLNIWPVASIGYGKAHAEYSDIEFFRKAGSVFTKCELRTEALILLSLVEQIDSTEDSHKKKVLQINRTREDLIARLEFIIPEIPISWDTKIEIEIENPDSESMEMVKKHFSTLKGYSSEIPYGANRFHLGLATKIVPDL